MEGTTTPSRGEFTGLFRTLKRPSALFFAPQPPEPSEIPVLRGSPGQVDHALSEREYLWIRRSRRIQKLMSFLFQQQGRQTDLPGVDRGESAELAGERARRWLGVNVELQMSWDASVDPWLWWRTTLDERGVFVFALQLGREGIRGFSFSDEVAPVIAVNTAYNRGARIFTTFHEIGHLILRSRAMCVDLGSDVAGEERWCEEFAASALLPRDAVLRFVNEVSEDEDHFGLARKVAEKFKVSIRAAAIRLIRLDIVPRSLYALVDRSARGWDHDKGFARGHPTFRIRRRIHEYGSAVIVELIRAHAGGILNLHDLSDYLRLDTSEVADITQLVDAGG